MHEKLAKMHVENAVELRKGTEWDVPTFGEWETRERAADEAYCKEIYPEEYAQMNAREGKPASSHPDDELIDSIF